MIHFTNGDATADLLSLADVPGDIRVVALPLDDGPLAIAPAAELTPPLLAWNQAQAAKRGAPLPAKFATAAAAAAQAGKLTARELADEVVLWFEHDVFDQLNLVRLLADFAMHGAPATLTMVSIDRHPSVVNFLGFGQLAEADLAALWPQRTPLAKDAFDEAAAAWIALTSPDPRAVGFFAKRVKTLPYVGSALERWLEEFPDVSSGLTRTEREVLAAVARGVNTPGALLSAVQAVDPRWPLTDLRCAQTLADLRAAQLLAPDTMAVTAVGRACLAAAHDRITDAGIDTWRGGVRLLGHGPMWRWDTTTKHIVWR